MKKSLQISGLRLLTDQIRRLRLLLLLVVSGLSVTAGPGAANSMPAADFVVKGKVSDDVKNEILPGVSILIKGTQRGTTSDEKGTFSISVPDQDAVLVFSFLGYETQEMVVGSASTLDIALKADTKSLSEVVVVGYGTQKKTSVTAAVSTLKGDEVTKIPIANLSNGLGGRLSGVIVKQGSGEPGQDGSNIYIRGVSSTGATQPLLIVDNIPRPFQQLDPNTIESFTVLKDAAAVAPYGVAGANGVILVTTKRGKTGAPVLSYNGYVGFQNPTVLPDFVNSYQYATLRNAAAVNEGLPIPFSDYALQKYQDGSDPDAYPTFKDIWGDITNKNTIITAHNLELSGGTDKVKYYASFGYQHQDGMWAATNNNRYNLAINLDAQATKTTKISLNLNGRVQQVQSPSVSTGRIFELVGYLHPLYGPLKFSNGMYGTFLTGSLFDSGYRNINTTSVYSQLSVEQDIPFIPGLKLKGTIAYDPTMVNDKTWTKPVQRASIDTTVRPYLIKDGIFGQTKSSLTQTIDHSNQLTYQAGFNYTKSFGRSSITALGIFEAKSNNQLYLSAARRNFNLSVDEIDMGSSSQADMSTGGSSSMGRQMGLVYRVTYDFSDKYLFEASGRYDGSYYFAPDQRFGFFPAFSVGWRLSEENFMKNKINWIDNLKVRASYGEVGALAGTPFQYLSTYSVLGTDYVIGKNAVQGIRERAEPNPNITWERAKKTDVGFEATLWKGLINMEADYFYEKRSNMLMNPDVIVPAEYGVGLSQVNAGIMDNRGVDLSISSSRRLSKDLSVSLGGTFTFAKNKLLKVFETPVTYDNPNRRQTGRSLGTRFGFRDQGYFQVSDFDEAGNLNAGIATQPWGKVQPGDIRYQDLNGDGQINDNDLTAIGDPAATPRIIYGISPSVRFKGLSLDLLFQGAARVNWYYDPSSIMPFWDTMLPYTQNFDYWTPENPNASNPRLTSSPTVNNSQISSFWMGDASYLRLKNATLAYNLPTRITQKIGVPTLRLYVSGQNMLTWTKLMNYDPEIGPNNSWKPNGSWGYPQQKVFSVGLNATF